MGHPWAVRSRLGWLALTLASCLAHASCVAVARAEVLTLEVPSGCGTPEGFTARLADLGAEPGDAEITVRVAPAWSGLFRGELRIDRSGAVAVERMIEDDVCADVVDALAISAALVLRSPPEPLPPPPPPEAEPSEGEVEVEVAPSPEAPPAVVPAGLLLRGVAGAGFRLGLGPVPGFSVAPELFGALEIERFVVGLHWLYWPEGGLLEASPGGQGVALQAMGTTLELGARIGDDVGLIASAVLELGAAVGRGLGVDRPRTEVAFTADVGASFVGYVEVANPAVASVRFFLRADLLFALAQPAYVLSSGLSYETPLVRGTGSAGLALVFGP